MFRVLGGTGSDCTGTTRRTFLQAGVLGVGGLALGDSSCAKANDEHALPHVEGASVILFWLSGGPGHMETWDPKPDAVAQYRGPFGAIQHQRARRPVRRAAARAGEDRWTSSPILRTVNHGSGDHTKGNHWMLTGFEGPAFNAPDFNVQRRPCMGSAVAKLARPEPARACRPTSPCRTSAAAPTTSSTTPPTSAAGAIRSSSSPTRTTPEFRVRNLAAARGPAARPAGGPPHAARRARRAASGATDRAAPTSTRTRSGRSSC